MTNRVQIVVFLSDHLGVVPVLLSPEKAWTHTHYRFPFENIERDLRSTRPKGIGVFVAEATQGYDEVNEVDSYKDVTWRRPTAEETASITLGTIWPGEAALAPLFNVQAGVSGEC